MDTKRYLGKRVALHNVCSVVVECGEVVAVTADCLWIRSLETGLSRALTLETISEDKAHYGYWWSEL